MKAQIEIQGVNKVRIALNSFGTKALQNLALEMVDVVQKVKLTARDAAPEKTGFLKGHITGSVTRNRVIVTGNIYAKAQYSIYQEFGSIKNPPTHFMRTGLVNNKGYIIKKLSESLLLAAQFLEMKRKIY